ncbi:MAG TPA: twin-arginine translocase TatA/TatE family subunit [Gemmatimonadaceae bacterium]|jgi:sec-independent protein translocase protein TatA|nr:twin-arginine translocase TatA/TatE family subunit [Gemmatimonadaceae bacterium]
MLGNLGFPEIMIILVIVLLLFGAKRIPEIAGSMGKGIKEFKKNINEATRDIDEPPRYENRLGSSDLDRPRTADRPAEEVRPEPKRLI